MCPSEKSLKRVVNSNQMLANVHSPDLPVKSQERPGPKEQTSIALKVQSRIRQHNGPYYISAEAHTGNISVFNDIIRQSLPGSPVVCRLRGSFIKEQHTFSTAFDRTKSPNVNLHNEVGLKACCVLASHCVLGSTFHSVKQNGAEHRVRECTVTGDWCHKSRYADRTFLGTFFSFHVRFSHDFLFPILSPILSPLMISIHVMH